ncbi:unnamed protein product [Schistosoma mattheei]|uniref:Uncharacterized protein n=1 Tax=Schistosoma mattheei TaxID=31246 RepID=A0A183PI28_9TREM|nr:unnamed protein product [Schistosoma mattheei]
MDRTTLWKLLQHYGVPQKIVNIIRNSNGGLNSKIVHRGQLIDSFKVIEWIMKTSTFEEKHGIQWTSRMQLDDLDLADELALLSQTQQRMQETISVAAASAAVGLNIHKGKSKILRHNTTCNNPITIKRDLEDVKTFTYLGSIIDEQGGSDADVKAQIAKNLECNVRYMLPVPPSHEKGTPSWSSLKRKSWLHPNSFNCARENVYDSHLLKTKNVAEHEPMLLPNCLSYSCVPPVRILKMVRFVDSLHH